MTLICIHSVFLVLRLFQDELEHTDFLSELSEQTLSVLLLRDEMRLTATNNASWDFIGQSDPDKYVFLSWQRLNAPSEPLRELIVPSVGVEIFSEKTAFNSTIVDVGIAPVDIGIVDFAVERSVLIGANSSPDTIVGFEAGHVVGSDDQAVVTIERVDRTASCKSPNQQGQPYELISISSTVMKLDVNEVTDLISCN